jgi:Na+-transporting NADH:ubiquinone oxidoreductase subunit NqrC
VIVIDNDSIEKYILPGLQILKKDAEHIEGQFKNSIQQLITDMEGAVKKEDDNKSTPSKSKAFFDKMKPSTPSFFNKKQ